MPPPDRERGAALLTVLLLVAVVAVLAAAGLERLRLATRLGGNAADIERARSFAEAAEVLALSRVDQLLGQNRQRVSLAGGWSDRPFGLPLPDGGTAVARVTDGGNCFNLNGLVTAVSRGVYASDATQQVQFVRLMQLLGVPVQQATHIAAAAADWIDTDTVQQISGAEDAAYLTQAIPYRTAGTLMADPSELRAVDGVTPAIFAELRPSLCTLPVAEPAPVNVNTLAPEQAPLVAARAPDTLTVEAARGALMRRPLGGWSDASGFWSAAGVSAGGAVGVTSTWFTLRIDVVQGGTQVTERALIDASRLPARLVSRQWGEDL